MIKTILTLFLILTSVTLTVAFASEDEVDREALAQTQALLKDKSSRDAVISQDSKAKKADQMAQDVVGANTDEIYGVSADVLAVISKESQGNPDKMQKLLEKASRDPAGFLMSLPPEIRNKISHMAEKSPLQNSEKKKP